MEGEGGYPAMNATGPGDVPATVKRQMWDKGMARKPKKKKRSRRPLPYPSRS